MNQKEILTDRLLLRPITFSDVAILTKLFSHEEVRKYLGGALSSEAAEKKAQDLVGKNGYFLVIVQNNKKVVGAYSISKYRTGDMEVSYEFFPDFWGQGYGKEAVQAVIKLGFEKMGLQKIIGVTQETNIRSRKLLESFGMVVVDKFIEFSETQVMYAIERTS